MKPRHDTPCKVTVRPLAGGGVEVTVAVPTYEGWSKFTTVVERDADSDWQVFVPGWPVEMGDELGHDWAGHEFGGGIAYLGAPEAP